jgi:hypothetical protein
MYVTSAFARKYLSSIPNQGKFGVRTPPAIHNVTYTIFGLHFKAPIIYVVERAGDADVLLGSPLFSRFRVTIDRFRGVVLAEENR